MSIEALNYVRSLALGDKYPTRKYILTLIADRCDEAFSCFPSVPLIAAEAEISDRAVQRAIASLRNDGYVSDRVRYAVESGRQTSNRYVVHGPWDNYGGTGRPFRQIVTPKEKRADAWARTPLEGDFREGTAAHNALNSDVFARQEPNADAENTDDPSDASDTRDVNADVFAGRRGVTLASPGRVTPASPGGVTPTSPLESPVVPTTANDPHAPSARSAPDARRASTGRTARVKNGASGAAGKTGMRMDRATATAYRSVVAALPALLRNPAVGRPLPAKVPANPLGSLILEQLGHRTPAQLAARIERRWVEHRWAAKLEGREPVEEMLSGVGVAVALLRSPECPDAACEDGTYIDGGACRTCAEGSPDRARTARGAAPRVPGARKPPTGPHGAGERPRCVRCGEVFPASAGVPSDCVCKPCHDEERRDGAGAAEAAQRWAREDAALRGEPVAAGAPF